MTIAHRIGKTEGEAGEMEPDWSKEVIRKTYENALLAQEAAEQAQKIVENFKPEGGGSITATDDGKGNVTLTTYGVSVTDDGNGNVTIK